MIGRIGRRWGFAASVVVLAYYGPALFAQDEPPKGATPEIPPLVNEDVPEPLTPKKPRSTADADLLEAESLYSAGRLYEQREQYGQALKMYQKALRHDPNSVTILQQIWPLAFRLDRPAEGVRYALKAAELDPSNQELLVRLTRLLVDSGDAARALRLFERTIDAKVVAPGKPEYYTIRKQMGELYVGEKKYSEAADCFKVVQEALADPKKAGLSRRQERTLLGDAEKTYEQFGQAYLKAGRLDDAVKAFELAQKDSPNRALLAYHMAQVFLQKKEPEKALGELEVYFASKPEPAGREPYEFLKVALEQTDAKDDLIPRLEELLRADEENATLGYFLADELLAAGRATDAEEKYTHFLKRSPDPAGFEGLAKLYLGKNDPAGLLRSLALSVEQGDQTDLARSLMATEAPSGLAISKNAELSKAIIDYAVSTLEKTPDEINFSQRITAAILAAETKDFDHASKLFESAVAKAPKPLMVYQEWGMAAMQGERFDEAARIFRKILDDKLVEAGDPTYLYHLAGALEMAGKTDEALAAAREAIAANPEIPLLHRRVAWIFYHAGRHDEALEEYKKITQTFAGTESAKEARLVMSNLYVLRKDMPNAESILEEVLDEFPDDPSASNDLGYLWADQNKNLDRSLHMVRLAVEADPDNKAYRDSLAWIYFRLGRYEEALAEQLKAMEDPDPDATLHDHLADIYDKLGKKTEAVEHWQHALEKYQKDKDADPVKVEKVKAKLELNAAK